LGVSASAHCLRFLGGLRPWEHSFTRLWTLWRAVLWRKGDVSALLDCCGTAQGSFRYLARPGPAWEKNLLAAAMEQVRERIEERQFQVFDLYVTKGWLPGQVAKTLGISMARVYLTKHRVTAMLNREVRRLEQEAEKRLRGAAG
jgi:hypothetical protein